MTQQYIVEWVIEIDADTPEEAARTAWEAMRRPDSIANHFTCTDEAGEKHDVDLLEIDEAKETERINHVNA